MSLNVSFLAAPTSSLGREFAFVVRESGRSGSHADQRQVTAALLPDTAHRANGSTGRGPEVGKNDLSSMV